MRSQLTRRYILLLFVCLSLSWTSVSPAQLKSKAPKPSKRVLGVVVDQTDQPIPTAIVNLTNLQAKKVSQDITDDKGEFQFGGLSPDADYDVQAIYHNVQGPVERISIYDTRSKREFYWKLPTLLADARQEIDLIIGVSDEKGRGIPGATVKFTGTKKIETLIATTDSNGRTDKWLSPNENYSVVTEAMGYQTDVGESFKVTREAASLRVVLKPAK